MVVLLSIVLVQYIYSVSEDCENNICENKATCKILAGDYICECLSGYIGVLCENKGTNYSYRTIKHSKFI